MTWEQFKDREPITINDSPYKITEIDCPQCKTEKILMRTDIVLTSYPAKYQYECHKCGWVGYSFNRV